MMWGWLGKVRIKITSRSCRHCEKDWKVFFIVLTATCKSETRQLHPSNAVLTKLGFTYQCSSLRDVSASTPNSCEGYATEAAISNLLHDLVLFLKAQARSIILRPWPIH